MVVEVPQNDLGSQENHASHLDHKMSRILFELLLSVRGKLCSIKQFHHVCKAASNFLSRSHQSG